MVKNYIKSKVNKTILSRVVENLIMLNGKKKP